MRTAIRHLSWAAAALVIAGGAATALTAWHAGYRIYVVHTGSMEPTLKPGDAVLDRPAPSSVRPGEIVTFSVHSGPDSVVTHRVASYDGTIVKTKGDANRSVDPWSLHLSQIVGSTVTRLPLAGYALVYLRHPQGAASVASVVIGLILLWQLFFPAQPSQASAVAGGARGVTRRGRHRVRMRAPRPSPPAGTAVPRAPAFPLLPPARLLESYQATAAVLRPRS
jgi:signal peptidase